MYKKTKLSNSRYVRLRVPHWRRVRWAVGVELWLSWMRRVGRVGARGRMYLQLLQTQNSGPAFLRRPILSTRHRPHPVGPDEHASAMRASLAGRCARAAYVPGLSDTRTSRRPLRATHTLHWATSHRSASPPPLRAVQHHTCQSARFLPFTLELT